MEEPNYLNVKLDEVFLIQNNGTVYANPIAKDKTAVDWKQGFTNSITSERGDDKNAGRGDGDTRD